MTSQTPSPDRATAPRSRWGLWVKVVAINLVVVVSLIAAFEFSVRIFGWDREAMSAPLPKLLDAQFQAVHRYDPLLFFSLRPNITKPFGGVTVTTNSLGLRSPELGPKAPNEFRILSLGESTSFGAGVESAACYAAKLEARLNQNAQKKKYTVINAGVSAYTSFQSRVYLERRGLELKPDMVLLYHELNDFLPTTNREALVPDQQGFPLSDKQLFESQRRSYNRMLLEWSALYRVISNLMIEYRVDRYQTATPQGAGHIHVPTALQEVSTPEGMRKLNLPPRVPLADRRENLQQILALCRARNIPLVVLHPSYAESDRHECDLTEFCREFNVPMFDVYDCLHPAGASAGAMFVDLWHPNAEGHACIAEGLFYLLASQKLVPAAN